MARCLFVCMPAAMKGCRLCCLPWDSYHHTLASIPTHLLSALFCKVAVRPSLLVHTLAPRLQGSRGEATRSGSMAYGSCLAHRQIDGQAASSGAGSLTLEYCSFGAKAQPYREGLAAAAPLHEPAEAAGLISILILLSLGLCGCAGRLLCLLLLLLRCCRRRRLLHRRHICHRRGCRRSCFLACAATR
jgi:hypothetical protein